jgi:hypothetical protein
MESEPNRPWEEEMGKYIWTLFSDIFEALNVTINTLKNELHEHRKSLMNKMIT